MKIYCICFVVQASQWHEMYLQLVEVIIRLQLQHVVRCLGLTNNIAERNSALTKNGRQLVCDSHGTCDPVLVTFYFPRINSLTKAGQFLQAMHPNYGPLIFRFNHSSKFGSIVDADERRGSANPPEVLVPIYGRFQKIGLVQSKPCIPRGKSPVRKDLGQVDYICVTQSEGVVITLETICYDAGLLSWIVKDGVLQEAVDIDLFRYVKHFTFLFPDQFLLSVFLPD